MKSINTLSAASLQALLKQGKKIKIIDVRGSDEFAREHIPNAQNIPLDQLSEKNAVICEDADCVIVHCQAGVRTRQAAEQLQQAIPNHQVLEGGLNAWKKIGGQLTRNTHAPLPLHRQVFMAVGILIVIVWALGMWVSPWFNWLILFFGCALFFAGATGICAMATLLAKLPYNQPK